MVPACTNGPTDEYFLVQHTWVKVFLPTLMHLFFILEQPFQDFTSKSPSFVAIVQQAFNATHPNISYVVTAHNDIVATVRITYDAVCLDWTDRVCSSGI